MEPLRRRVEVVELEDADAVAVTAGGAFAAGLVDEDLLAEGLRHGVLVGLVVRPRLLRQLRDAVQRLLDPARRPVPLGPQLLEPTLQSLVGRLVLDCGTGLQEPAARAAQA